MHFIHQFVFDGLFKAVFFFKYGTKSLYENVEQRNCPRSSLIKPAKFHYNEYQLYIYFFYVDQNFVSKPIFLIRIKLWLC